jgi:hypothetical protein
MPSAMPIIRSMVAKNTAWASGNPLHDRAKAIALGYKNALISGADTVRYLTYPPVYRWGRKWFEHGMLDCKLLKPIFDGEMCDIAVSTDGDSDFAIDLRVQHELRATAQCSLLPRIAVPSLDDIPWQSMAPERARLPADRLVIGTALPTAEDHSSLRERSAFITEESDDLSIYTDEELLHPGYLIRLSMYTFARNFVTDVLIHVGSRLRNYRPIHRMAKLEARARVLAIYETRGHKAVLLDINIIADEVVSASVRHRMIYQLRDKP